MGTPVQEGDLLAELDTAALELELQNAQEEVKIYQAQLDELLKDPQATLAEQAEKQHTQEVAQAEVVLQVAQLHLEEARTSATGAAETARLNWEIAANTLRDVQDTYSRIYWENELLRQRGIEVPQTKKDAEASAWRRVEDAEAAMEQARLAYEQAASPISQSLLEAEVDMAWLELEALRDWVNPYTTTVSAGAIAQAEARLRQAELAVERLELQLQTAVLRAPFDGVISAVYLHPAEWGAPGNAVLEIVDTSRWYVETRNVSELRIGQIQLGQEATVHINAFASSELPAWVSAISPVAVVQQGDTTYTLVLELDPTDLQLWPGMTARAVIRTQ
jgi:HlyD family secretion protein